MEQNESQNTTSFYVINLPVCRETVFLAALTKFIFVFQYSEQMQKEPTYTEDGLINGRGALILSGWTYIRNTIFVS